MTLLPHPPFNGPVAGNPVLVLQRADTLAAFVLAHDLQLECFTVPFHSSCFHRIYPHY